MLYSSKDSCIFLDPPFYFVMSVLYTVLTMLSWSFVVFFFFYLLSFYSDRIYNFITDFIWLIHFWYHNSIPLTLSWLTFLFGYGVLTLYCLSLQYVRHYIIWSVKLIFILFVFWCFTLSHNVWLDGNNVTVTFNFVWQYCVTLYHELVI